MQRDDRHEAGLTDSVGFHSPAEPAAEWSAMETASSGSQPLRGPHGIVLDLAGHTAWVYGHELMLSTREFLLLQILVERWGETVDVNELARAAWGYETVGNRNFIEATVSRLRRKLVTAGMPWRTVSTIRGVGYSVNDRQAS